MTTQKNSSDSRNSHVRAKLNLEKSAVDVFVKKYNSNTIFFTDAFIRKIRNGNRRALAELKNSELPPTLMDLRAELAACVKEHVADDHVLQMNDSKRYTIAELKRLVPEWAALAETALMESDPALADKLMTREQWNAKSAFEVTFLTALNEVNTIKELKGGTDFEYYRKWVIAPLKLAMEQIKRLTPPGNALIGHSGNMPLAKAMKLAENMEAQFEELLQGKKSRRFFGLL
jgi:hypothetical protein